MERALHRDLLVLLLTAVWGASCRDECATKAGGCEAADDSVLDSNDSVPDSADTDTDTDTDADSDTDTDTDSPPDTGTPNLSDDDLDGYTVYGGDCDDTDPSVNLAATEVCEDGKDNDCDGTSNGCGPQSQDLSEAVEYTGSGHQDFAGDSVAGAGDVNADGFDDLVIGAPNYYGQGESGRACLVLGSATPASASLDDTICYSGEDIGDLAGISVSGAGDFNADGFADFVVGTDLDEWETDGVGHAYVVLGCADPSAGSLSETVEYSDATYSYDYLGEHVAGVGDIDGDGFDDVGLWASEADWRGVVYLVLGSASPASAVLSAPIAFSGVAEHDLAGRAIAAAGDFDGDGLDDMVIGAPGRNDDAGAAFVVLGEASPSGGSLSSAIEYSAAESGRAGFSVANAGDVDADGHCDVVIGAREGGGGAGVAYLVYGESAPASLDLADAVQFTSAEGGFLGAAVDFAGDVNRDGYGDLLLGEPWAGGDASGRAFLLLGTGL